MWLSKQRTNRLVRARSSPGRLRSHLRIVVVLGRLALHRPYHGNQLCVHLLADALRWYKLW